MNIRCESCGISSSHCTGQFLPGSIWVCSHDCRVQYDRKQAEREEANSSIFAEEWTAEEILAREG